MNTPTVTEARDAAIVRICDCECTAEFGHSGVLCRRAGIGKVDALIAAVRAEERQQRAALVAALRFVDGDVRRGEPCPICSSAPHILNCGLVAVLAQEDTL